MDAGWKRTFLSIINNAYELSYQVEQLNRDAAKDNTSLDKMRKLYTNLKKKFLKEEPLDQAEITTLLGLVKIAQIQLENNKRALEKSLSAIEDKVIPLFKYVEKLPKEEKENQFFQKLQEPFD